MSVKDSWLIVQDTDWREFLPLFQLNEVEGEPEKPEFGYIELPGGWAVLWGGSNRFHGQNELLEASRLGLAFRLEMNDQVTYLSALAAAKDGEQLWEVMIGEDEKLILSGSPPLEINALRALTSDFDEQMGDDHDIPLALAKSLTGFDYDEFLEKIRYLEPTVGSPFSPPLPRRNGAESLRMAMIWWEDQNIAFSTAAGEAKKYAVYIFLWMAPFIFLIFLLSVIYIIASPTDY